LILPTGCTAACGVAWDRGCVLRRGRTTLARTACTAKADCDVRAQLKLQAQDNFSLQSNDLTNNAPGDACYTRCTGANEALCTQSMKTRSSACLVLCGCWQNSNNFGSHASIFCAAWLGRQGNNRAPGLQEACAVPATYPRSGVLEHLNAAISQDRNRIPARRGRMLVGDPACREALRNNASLGK
jgi:hypothetical protein